MTIGLLQSHNLIEVVNGLHWRSSLEIHKMLKDNGDFCICYTSGEGDGLSKKINVEKMLGILPMHLMTVLMSPDRDEKRQYLLSGIRLLQTFCDLTSRHAKLEQVLLDDVKLSAQMLELVIFTIVVLGVNRQIHWRSRRELLVDATLLASCLYLMHGFISPNYQDLVQVLLVHPKVDLFIEGAFGAVHNVVRSLECSLLYQQQYLPDTLCVGPLVMLNTHCQQAEAALQFLHSLCQHKLFRDRVAKNEELCGNGGVLMVARTILSLLVTPQFIGSTVIGSTVMLASISRMKAKVLSILQHLFEAESVSFLDEVANAGNLDLARDFVYEVYNLLAIGLCKASKCIAAPEYPMGFVLLNAMRLADVLTDDSNFRSIFIENLSIDLSAVFCLSHEDFLSMLCSSGISSKEDEANVDYDLFASVGWALTDFSSFGQSATPQLKLNLQNNLTMASYAHQRSSLLIKMIANLHCFVPNLCKEEDRNRFIQNIMNGLRKDPSRELRYVLPCTSYTPMAERGTSVSKNICSLLRHAESLIPHSVNEEDFMIFRVFCDQLQQLIYSEFTESQVQFKDIQGTGENLFGKEPIKEPLNLNKEEASENFDAQVEGVIKRQDENEEMEIVERSKEKESDVDASNLETSGSDTSSNRGKSLVNQVENGDLVQTMSTRIKESRSGEVKEDEKAETLTVFEKQRKKRKRSIMNEDQMEMIEKALTDEPDMQRNSASIQLWANKLSQTGSEVITSSQLKNWLNNRKAKLARASKQTGPVRDNNSSGDLPDSPADENTWQQRPSRNQRTGENQIRSSSSSEEGLKRGKQVILIDERGDEIGKGIVVRRDGEWYGLSLETRQVCVVDVMELSGSYDWQKMVIPYGSDDVGRTFGEANLKFGVMRVAWDVNLLQFQTLLH